MANPTQASDQRVGKRAFAPRESFRNMLSCQVQ